MLRLSELYTSVQGEGPNVGTPTTFVRFAGCNYRCAGWPCDTPYAIFPEQIKEHVELVEPRELVKRMKAAGPRHFCITGGEPLLQSTTNLQWLFKVMYDNGWTYDLFTNGSFPLEQYVASSPRDNLYPNVTVIMDWKLNGSGEGNSDLLERDRNRRLLRAGDAIKFVVKDKADMLQAMLVSDTWALQHQVYMSPAWDVIEPQEIVAFIEDHKLWHMKLNLQTHKYIYGGDAKGV